MVQHMLHQIKTSQFYTDLGFKKNLLNPPENGKNQGLFKAFECFSNTFQGKFQDSPVYSSTFQACANPGIPDLKITILLKNRKRKCLTF